MWKQDLKNNQNIQNILEIYNKSKSDLIFNKSCQSILKKMSSPEFIHSVFEANLSDEEFINKEWKIHEIPYLNVYKDEFIDIKIHVFLPSKKEDLKNASHLIHNHKEFNLNSYIFYGKGYHSIEFDNKIIQNNDGSVEMKITKDFFHSNGNINNVNSWSSHVIFNVPDICASIVLWSREKTNSKSFVEKLLNLNSNKKKPSVNQDHYYVKKNKFYPLENSSVNKTHHTNLSVESNELHINAICYLLQLYNYNNKIFLDKILSNSKTPKLWAKYLIDLKNKSLKLTYIDNTLNVFNKSFTIDDVRKSSKQKIFLI